MRMEEQLFNTRRAEGRRDKLGKAHTTFTQDTNSNAQKGTSAGGAARSLSTSHHDYSTAESGVEEVHVAFVLVYGQIPTLTQAESFLKPFHRNVVQPATLEQYLDYFCPGAHLIFFKKRDEHSELLFTRMLEAENVSSSTFLSQPSLIGHGH
jgi:hypothetical protein